ncbi:hypothetical protein DICPUDRAFT_154856 [Dictyostelium purpureum]|uniref:Uncharacterized protein n=1 Tax=Dictyostelium purpureum TaxID=5786 RepID=F0ZSG0_DICPU|nr:uncharacterized protein DICPUDRAFT_154856 [Dictyostelium purpureum]EGC33123.1 hypothetical protein DICPUDRAFT_154856 [Dictyostelium purpureum]|eukprot:XP_003290360.1 hypothetical protein DICPUDRAFT_154856 [Dictyostelium purpureum]
MSSSTSPRTNESRRPPPTMCDNVRAASLKCSEQFSKFECKVFFEAATKCRSTKIKLEDEEKEIKKYLKGDLTDLQRSSLENRLEEINKTKSTQFPVPI